MDRVRVRVINRTEIIVKGTATTITPVNSSVHIAERKVMLRVIAERRRRIRRKPMKKNHLLTITFEEIPPKSSTGRTYAEVVKQGDGVSEVQDNQKYRVFNSFPVDSSDFEDDPPLDFWYHYLTDSHGQGDNFYFSNDSQASHKSEILEFAPSEIKSFDVSEDQEADVVVINNVETVPTNPSVMVKDMDDFIADTGANHISTLPNSIAHPSTPINSWKYLTPSESSSVVTSSLGW